MAVSSCDELTREDFDAGPSSCNEIEPNLYLGNLTAATDVTWLKNTKITHILTVDSCPLPRNIQSRADLTIKFIQITDMPEEDILIFFEEAYQFIDDCLQGEGRVLVHCYFGVSRSATLVIAYIMKKHEMNLDAAFDLVKSKRRFVGPNVGFLEQLKLYKDMGCSIDHQNTQFKVYRLQKAAEKVNHAKILPLNFYNLIKSDPAVFVVHPEATVYRCKKCRRILARASNVLPHRPYDEEVGTGSERIMTESETLPEILKSLSVKDEEQKNFCTKTYFIEPLEWMTNISQSLEGKLNCPKCDAKLGSFSWLSGCRCPCGIKMTPGFYLVPSKVDWSNIVQNLEATI